MRPAAFVNAIAVAGALMLAACGSTEAAQSSSPSPSASGTADVAIVPGGLARGRLNVGDDVVEYVTITPNGFSPGDVAPVMFALPPGGQDPDLTESVANGIYLEQAVARGWVVFSPARPESGSLYFSESVELVPALMDWVETWVQPEGDAFHVVGVSNGGLSAFSAAAVAPDRVGSILVFPGYARGDVAQAALAELAEVPVIMFVGADDTTWIPAMEETRVALEDLGGDVTMEIFAGEGHVIGGLSDGVRIFDELAAAR